MDDRRVRRAKALFAATWAGGLVLTLRAGATAHDVNPEQLLALIPATYLAAWGLAFFLSRAGRAVDAARFLACTASALLTLALVEAPAALGLVDYRTVFSTPTPPWRRPDYRPDPELIWARLGDRRARWVCQGGELHMLWGATPWATYHCDLRLDRDGFRNPPGPAPADLAVLGDSFVEGAQVAEPELVTAHLARLTGRAVANLGRSGYGPQQELAVLRRYALPNRPRACVWAFYEGNDLQDVDAYESYRHDLPQILHDRRSGSLYGRSFARNALAFLIRTWLRPAPRRPARLFTGRFLDRSGRAVPIYFGTGVQHGEGSPALPRDGCSELLKVRSILAEAHALCRGQGTDLVVVFVPSKFRVYRGACSFESDSPCRSWPVDDLPCALRSAVAAVSPEVGFLDLTPSLQAEAADGSLLYLPDDPHWTAEGHRAAARALADYLVSRPRSGGAPQARATAAR
jgi:hypothetical protein